MKSKLIVGVLAFIVIPLSAAVFTNMGTVGPVIGKIDSLQLENDGYYLLGWACQKGSPNSLNVHVYAGGAYGQGGKQVGNGLTDYVAESEVTDTAMCASKSAAKHRFKLRLSEALLEANQGKAIYVHGISLIANAVNPTIENSGTFRFPAPLAKAPRGCAQSPMAIKSTRNTYMTEYSQAQGDTWIYTAWVWRETPDASTNHSLSIARTKDMINWYNTCGEKLKLPITTDERTVVDAVLPQNGIMNNLKLGFDSNSQPIITYQKNKYELSTKALPKITTQIYNARLEANGWRIYQTTSWQTKTNQAGGGSLAKSEFSPGYSGITLDRGGIMYQRLTRPKADETGFPATGDYVVSEVKGSLQVTGEKYKVKAAPKDPFNPTSGISALKIDLEKRHSSWKTPFGLKTLRTTAEERWQVLRGDWDGDGANTGGLFDRRTRLFVIRDGAQDRRFLFGPGRLPLYPLVADWNGDGVETIGVHDTITGAFYAKNSFQGGLGDTVGQPLNKFNIRDGVNARWYSVNPSRTHTLTYESLGANNDLPFACDGTPYIGNSAETRAGGQKTLETCPEKFLSDLRLNIYDEKSKKWNSIHIDRVWGIGGSFAFKVFKGHQIMAYYDKDRNVKVAIRNSKGVIKYQILDDVFKGWDSHNNLTLSVDENHDIHLSGNQHVNAMNYWRSRGLEANFKRYSQTGMAETEVTYPSFFRSPDGELLYQYRNGMSGDGEWVINQYDIRKRTWKRMMQTSLFGAE